MPYHKIPRASLHQDIRELEHEHEIVVQVLNRPDDPDYVDVFTRYCATGEVIELRSDAAGIVDSEDPYKRAARLRDLRDVRL